MTGLNILIIILVFSVLLKIYLKLKTKRCTSKVCLVGKTVVVTGANTGIGYEAALEFAKRGARVILGCRNEAKAVEARDKIIRDTQNPNVVFKPINFASLKSVRDFAKDILETEARLDVLVNNAGVGVIRPKLSDDGLQMHMQVNYFGPFLLTILLIELLKKSAPSRIVNVSSKLAAYSKLDLNQINSYVEPQHSYRNSKLCNILFTMHLATILEKSNVTVYSLHPGVVDTDIFNKFTGYRKYIKDFLRVLYFKTPEEGAQTTIFAAVERGIETYSGKHFNECQVVKTYSTASDADLPKNLWEKTVELLKCEEEVKDLQCIEGTESTVLQRNNTCTTYISMKRKNCSRAPACNHQLPVRSVSLMRNSTQNGSRRSRYSNVVDEQI